MNKPYKLIRIATVPLTLYVLLRQQLSFLSGYFDLGVISSPGAELDRLHKETGIATHSVPMERRIAPLKDLVSVWKMYWLLRKLKPDIIHSMTPKAGLVSMIAGFFAGVPCRIHTFSGLVFPSRKGMMRRLLIFTDRLICLFATHLIPEGEGVKKDLQKVGITRKPLDVLGYGSAVGLDTMHYARNNALKVGMPDIREKLKYNASDVVILYVGRLVKDKGLVELVNAFARLHAKHPEAKLMLVGPFEPHIDPLPDHITDTLMSHKAIVIVGHQDDVRPYYMAADIFVLPSYREGFPNVVLEACSMDLPCIVTDINGSNEIVVPNVNGLVVPAGTSDPLYEAMEQMVCDKHMRTKFGNRSREVVAEKFGRDYVWNAIKSYYEDCLKESKTHV